MSTISLFDTFFKAAINGSLQDMSENITRNAGIFGEKSLYRGRFLDALIVSGQAMFEEFSDRAAACKNTGREIPPEHILWIVKAIKCADSAYHLSNKETMGRKMAASLYYRSMAQLRTYEHLMDNNARPNIKGDPVIIGYFKLGGPAQSQP